ncbi:hypothetical protein [Aerosakkonema funiforme]|uniref:vWA-MoxR associated protein N-terminal HTH domain-containing protein n=1 Tax=Aerosakkonema funiforme FACHB-1375 TaxID=2949571 RepID=A0A926ZIL6_9CYAN|nr:hypothetical protein [Aerosakkonema funiforme]MBD2181926.1 hypothetical protein [Aerosakkonema funiforme FACHB-1375]
MDSREVLEFVDEVVYAKTGKRLNDLQRGIIEGTLKRQKYSDIAKDYNCTTGHTKEVGFELWRLLSDIFGETVDKKHLKSILERQSNLNISFDKSSISSSIKNIIGCIKVGSEQPNPTPDKSQPATPDLQHSNNQQTKKQKIDKLRQHDLSDEEIAELLDLPLEVVKQFGLAGP